MLSNNYINRFEGLARVFGMPSLEHLQQAHFCIVGVGGVGSWAAEAAARSGIGTIGLIYQYDIPLSHTNCQIPAFSSSP